MFVRGVSVQAGASNPLSSLIVFNQITDVECDNSTRALLPPSSSLPLPLADTLGGYPADSTDGLAAFCSQCRSHCSAGAAPLYVPQLVYRSVA